MWQARWQVVQSAIRFSGRLSSGIRLWWWTVRVSLVRSDLVKPVMASPGRRHWRLHLAQRHPACSLMFRAICCQSLEYRDILDCWEPRGFPYFIRSSILNPPPARTGASCRLMGWQTFRLWGRQSPLALGNWYFRQQLTCNRKRYNISRKLRGTLK